MPIERLDHVNLRTAQLDAMIAWYRDILGLAPGARPDFAFAGAWLYAGDAPVIHLVETDRVGVPAGTLALEHFALTASGPPDAFEARLKAAGQTYRRKENTLTQCTVFDLTDPDGTHIHVDFAWG